MPRTRVEEGGGLERRSVGRSVFAFFFSYCCCECAYIPNVQGSRKKKKKTSSAVSVGLPAALTAASFQREQLVRFFFLSIGQWAHARTHTGTYYTEKLVTLLAMYLHRHTQFKYFVLLLLPAGGTHVHCTYVYIHMRTSLRL